MTRITAFFFAALMAASFAASTPARALSEQQELIDKSIITIEKLAGREDIRDHVRKYLREARGVFIVPALIKGAFIVGGEGGTGVLMAKGSGNQWSYPAFYTMGAASFGLQAGGQVSETMLIIMTAKGLTSILENRVKIGGDLSAAVGPYGVGIEGSTTTAVGADIITYSIGKGAFLGGSIEGAVIERRPSMNYEYYNDTTATPNAILLDGKFANPQADRLRQVIGNVSAK
ncbi:MAG: lipid-binding SYLF domain-containing protein [Alphaproteobacteria bacterium]